MENLARFDKRSLAIFPGTITGSFIDHPFEEKASS